MAEDDGTEALRALIAQMQAQEVIPPDVLRERHRAFFHRANPVEEWASRPLAATNGSLDFLQRPDALQYVHQIKDDLAAQVRIVSDCFAEHVEFGIAPAPHYAHRICVILRRTGWRDLEEQFLAAWCRHFPDGCGATYAELNERLARVLLTKTKRLR